MLLKMGMVSALQALFPAHSISKSPLLAQAAMRIPWGFLSSCLGLSSPEHVTHRLLASGNGKARLCSAFSSKGSKTSPLQAAYCHVPSLYVPDSSLLGLLSASHLSFGAEHSVGSTGLSAGCVSLLISVCLG